MPNYGTIAICPFFQAEDPLKIKCEGVIQLNKAKTEFVMCFPSGARKKEWLSGYCETFQYGLCPYAAVLTKNYEERYNNGKTNRTEVTIIQGNNKRL
jgi:hypothetical protein